MTNIPFICHNFFPLFPQVLVADEGNKKDFYHDNCHNKSLAISFVPDTTSVSNVGCKSVSDVSLLPFIYKKKITYSCVTVNSPSKTDFPLSYVSRL